MSEFSYNIEEIELLTKDIDINKVLVNNSKYKDNIIIAYLLQSKKKQYKCEVKKCSVQNNWLDKPICLLLKRKNNKQSDAREANLEFNCPNCYYQNTNIKLIKKVEKVNFPKCDSCGFNLSKFSDHYKNIGLCKICYSKLSTKSEDSKSISVLYNILQEDSDNSDTENNINIEEYMNTTSLDNQFINSSNTNTNYPKLQRKKSKNNLSTTLELNLDLNLDLETLNLNDLNIDLTS